MEHNTNKITSIIKLYGFFILKCASCLAGAVSKSIHDKCGDSIQAECSDKCKLMNIELKEIIKPEKLFLWKIWKGK